MQAALANVVAFWPHITNVDYHDKKALFTGTLPAIWFSDRVVLDGTMRLKNGTCDAWKARLARALAIFAEK